MIKLILKDLYNIFTGKKRDRFKDVKKIINNDKPLIVDCGANEGKVTDIFLKQYKNPTIHVIEPIPELAEKLKNKYASNSNIIVHQNAIGAERRLIPFNICSLKGASSPLKPTQQSIHYNKDRMNIVKTIEVEQVRLDEVLKDCDVDILKLDIQGYEIQALLGMEKILNKIKIIVTEVAFIKLYENQPLFSDIDLFLSKRDFKLFNFYGLHTQPDGQLTSGDAVFLNQKILV